MKTLDTPWGAISVPGIVPDDIECGRCGRCCSGFVLSMRPTDMDNWYRQFKNNSPYEYPKDIGAIKHLMEPIPDAFTEDGQQIHTCRAFDRDKKTCAIFQDAPELRPIACWAFPYNYDFRALMNFPYPFCAIFQKTFRRFMEMYYQGLVNTYHPALTIVSCGDDDDDDDSGTSPDNDDDSGEDDTPSDATGIFVSTTGSDDNPGSSP